MGSENIRVGDNMQFSNFSLHINNVLSKPLLAQKCFWDNIKKFEGNLVRNLLQNRVIAYRVIHK